jgi:probable HAF family extracellular repeat protein
VANDITGQGWTVSMSSLCPPETGGCYGSGYDINDSGWAVGEYSWPITGAFLWKPGVGPRLLHPEIGGRALGINEKGVVVGSARNPRMRRTEAFTWTESGGFKFLGTLGGSFSEAREINDDGEVIGTSTTANGTLHTFLWTRDRGMRAIGIDAEDINKAGWIAGSRSFSGQPREALVRQPDGTMLNYGIFTGPEGIATGINAQNFVSGYFFDGAIDIFSKDGRKARAVVAFAPGRWRLLPALEGGDWNAALAINDKRQVVGWSEREREHYPYVDAFFWSEGTGAFPLYESGSGEATRALALNNTGSVVGQYWCCGGTPQPVIWTVTIIKQ